MVFKANGFPLWLPLFFMTAALGAEIHVSPTGNDAASGSATAPLATLAAARDKADQAKAGNQPVTILLHGGTYYLTAPLVIGPANSGTATAPIIYAAYPGDKPIISGGIKLPDTLTWKAGTGPIMVAGIGANLKVDQLFLNGKRQILARYPNFDSTKFLDGYDANCFGPARVALWKNPTEGPGYIRALHPNMWGGMSFIITGKNNDNTLAMQWVSDNNNGTTMHPTYRMVENIFEELDAPGEWFYRKSTGQLFFYPPAGANLEAAKIELASQDELIRVVGTATEKVSGIVFRNLTFAHTYRTLFSKPYEPILRSDWHIARAGAVYMENAEGIRVESCLFDQVGGNGIFMSGYNRNNVVYNNTFTDAGASCVNAIGLVSAVRCPFLWGNAAKCADRTPGPLTPDYPAFITIDNNTMTHFGRFEKQTAGVNLGITESDTVRHNTIHDCPRAGININTGRFGGHDISYNWVYNDLLESSDHGPFNSWGRDRNLDFKDDTTATTLDAWKRTVIHHNRFETKPGNFGIDLDDQSSNYLQYDNLLLGGGLKMQWHRYNTYTNNILVGGANVQMHGIWMGSQDVVTHNVFTSSQPYYIGFFPAGSYLPDTIKAHTRLIDSNCLAVNAGITSNEGNYTLAQWKTAGLDVHSVSGDPQFTDVNKTWTAYAPKGDYTVKAGSPALAIGFKNFPMDSFGVVAPVPTSIAQKPYAMDRSGEPGLFELRFVNGGLFISHDGDYRVRIATVRGRTVKVLNGSKGSRVYLETRGMSPGLYLATVQVRQGMESRVFILN